MAERAEGASLTAPSCEDAGAPFGFSSAAAAAGSAKSKDKTSSSTGRTLLTIMVPPSRSAPRKKGRLLLPSIACTQEKYSALEKKKGSALGRRSRRDRVAARNRNGAARMTRVWDGIDEIFSSNFYFQDQASEIEEKTSLIFEKISQTGRIVKN
jgi:hypothetical protein